MIINRIEPLLALSQQLSSIMANRCDSLVRGASGDKSTTCEARLERAKDLQQREEQAGCAVDVSP